ncbi:hypothetical protein [Isachenkonia alkalipeptolytica]|uniref:hypothetical protein n=1 Tax=Isachenkonia alkalipeptolytica TaxID=2565777 RepID=UPI00136B316C|nr:hypothetical protein [Isachenkonia alkalipeptolytica]
MELTYYKCPECGFMHQVPGYWSGFSPDEVLELQHVNLATQETCSEYILELVEDHDIL